MREVNPCVSDHTAQARNPQHSYLEMSSPDKTSQEYNTLEKYLQF